MQRRLDRRRLLALAGGGLALPLGVARAHPAWPDRPIRLIVPWPPGGSNDIIARILQPRLSAVLGQPIVIDNRGGAAGSTGAAEASRAPADGSTWMFTFDNEATNQTLMRLPYKLLEAFVPVTLIATGPLALVAHPSTPWAGLPALIAAAKAAPDTVTFATSGVGGLAHVATTLLQQQGGFSLVHVPYRGGGPALQDALSGQVPLFMSNVVVISQHIRAGSLKPLAVTTATESRHVPGIAPFAAQGFPGFDAPTWWAFFGRAGTPQPIIEKMHAALHQVLAEPEVRARVEAQGADVRPTSLAETRSFLAAEIERWGKVIRDNKITADS